MARRVHARTLTTKRAVAGEFARHPSPWILLTAITVPLVVRRRLGGPLRRADIVALVAVGIAQPLVEWALHRHVLHLAPRRIAGRTIDPGAAHRGHHRDPGDVAGALLGPGFAVADSALVAAGVGALGLGVAAATGAAPRVALTAVAGGEVGLAGYEWVHLLVHSGHRPRSAWFRRLRAQHHHHHFRNETTAFGITTTLLDRLLGTAGRPRSVVRSSAS